MMWSSLIFGGFVFTKIQHLRFDIIYSTLYFYNMQTESLRDTEGYSSLPSHTASISCLVDLLRYLRALAEYRLHRCDQHIFVTDPVCQRNCFLLIINLCNKPHRWDQPGNEDFKYCVFAPAHASPNDLFAPGRCSFSLWGTALACVLVRLIAVHWGDFVISYKSALHVLWWWVEIRTRLRCFEIPLSFEPLT